MLRKVTGRSVGRVAVVAALGILVGVATHVLADCDYGCYHLTGVTWTDPCYPCWKASEKVCPANATPTYGQDDPAGSDSTPCAQNPYSQFLYYKCTEGDPECLSDPSVAVCDYYTCVYVGRSDDTYCDTGS